MDEKEISDREMIEEEIKELKDSKPTLNIEQILQSERAWEYILLDIVKSNELDPWDLDISKLTQTYIERIRKMKELDLRIPARIILAAAILLRMKSETLTLSKSDDGRFEDLFKDELSDSPSEKPEDVPLLDLHLMRKPERKITLTDLIETLEEAFEKSYKERFLPNPGFALHMPEIDIGELIAALYAKIYGMPEKRIPFAKLLPAKTASAVIDIFLPLLHLANEQKIDFEQTGLFAEIFILKPEPKPIEAKKEPNQNAASVQNDG
ncbi:TPA: segregation/condensation protein A [archaeon]|nr:segregation/condensation protein A [Candidatus Naiadarchaeales archaeon SRR2090153.bin461]HIK03046.1 segregation/condensation protein A [Candidatus Naiadarchaeales archaeon SRR2090159.bin1288]